MKQRRVTHNFFKTLFLIVILLTVTTDFSKAAISLTQQIKEKRVTLNIEKKSIVYILTEIQKQTKINFGFNEDLNPTNMGLFSVNAKDKSVEEILKLLFTGTNYTYSIADNKILIESIAATPVVTQQQKNQKLTIRGKIIDEDKQPIVGATVIVPGTSNGAITNERGEFSIQTIKGESLEVSFTGMKPQIIQINSDQNLVIMMKRTMIEVDDVVVTGYQNLKQHENVGATEKIKAKDLDLSSNKSLEQMLEGKVAGLAIGNPSGAIGQRQRVRVRGTSSILGNQEPVWVVDGMIQEDPLPFRTSDFNSIADGSGEDTNMIKDFVGNSIAWLSPNDIEDITILKDVAATVLYGVKAANGVIVIRTKRGEIGKTAVSYSGSIDIKSPITYEKMNMMNSMERIDVDREIVESGRMSNGVIAKFGFEYLYNQYLNKLITFEQFSAEVAKLEVTNTDWLGILTKGTISQKHAINVSGGSNIINYYASFNYQNDKGNIPSNQSDKFNVNSNVQAWIIPQKLNFSMALRGSMTTTTGLIGEDPFNFARKTTRTLPAYDENGDLFFFNNFNNSSVSFLYNPIFEAQNRINKNKSNTINGNVNISWNVLSGLKIVGAFGFSSSSTIGEATSTELSNYITNIRNYEFGTQPYGTLLYESSQLPHGGELRKSETTNFNWTFRTQIDYNKVFNSQHRFGTTIGYEMRSNKYTGYDRVTYGYMPDKGKVITTPPLLIKNDKGDTDIKNNLYNKFRESLTDKLSNVLSFYANLSYSFDERYVLTFSIRSDASNRFGQNKKSQFLPVYSFGGRWNINNEPWMKSINHIVNNAAIRGSFGYQGNFADNYGPDLIVKYDANINNAFGELPLIISRLPYNDLTWEKTQSYNVGADFGLFKNKFEVSFNYYAKKTIDVITQSEVAYEWGISSIPINDGELTNSGWELSVTTTPVRVKDFVWSLSLNTAKNYNKIVSKTERKNDWRTATSGNLVKDGYPISTVWGPRYEGIDPENGLPIIGLNTKDGNYDKDDVTTWLYRLGKLEPDFTGGISMSFRYKTLSLSTSFTLNLGAKRWLANYMGTTLPRPMDNLSAEINNRWRKPGDELKEGVMPGLPYKGDDIMKMDLPILSLAGLSAQTEYKYNLYNRSDARFVSANFLKCNSISLSYGISAKTLKNIKLNNLRLGFNVTNPFRIVSKEFQGIDPEVAVGGLPLVSSYSISLSIGF